MPLNPQDEMRCSAFCGLATLYSFDDRILWAAGRYTKTIAGDANGLMVAGVDGKPEEKVLLWGLRSG